MAIITESKPNISHSMGCDPSQTAEFNEHIKKHGVRCAYYRADGALVTTSNKSRNQMIKAQNGNHFDRQGGYSEYCGE